MPSSLIKYGLVLLVLLVLVFNTLFVVPQTQQALVIQFGEIVRVIAKPGLKMRVPFVQNVIYFDKRILGFQSQPAEFITRDVEAGIDERVVIDAFVRYHIINPTKFFQAVKNEENLNSRLNSIVVSTMRRVLAGHSLNDLLSADRANIMRQLKEGVSLQTLSTTLANDATAMQKQKSARGAGFGIEIVDVRIMRAELPSDISQSTYERMRKNFTKEAQRFRAEGEQQAQEIRSGAERERTELIAEARRKSETIRGEGDGTAAKIYANAFSQDPEFFRFYRSMQAYRKSMSKDDTTLVISPNSSFLREMNP
jgi:membrane protease subunit HflC